MWVLYILTMRCLTRKIKEIYIKEKEVKKIRIRMNKDVN